MDALGRREFLLRMAGQTSRASQPSQPSLSGLSGLSGLSCLRAQTGPIRPGGNDPSAGDGRGRAAEPRRVPIGRFADFPPGRTRILAAEGLAIESLPEGLRARYVDPGGGWFAVGADGTGALHVDRGRAWPADLVFSIMTGEACRLEDRKEGEG